MAFDSDVFNDGWQNVRIMAWTFDFHRMIAMTNSQVYLLTSENGVLHYRTSVADCPKRMANSGNKIFDDAVTRAWQSFVFERDVLNSK